MKLIAYHVVKVDGQIISPLLDSWEEAEYWQDSIGEGRGEIRVEWRTEQTKG